MLESLDLVGVVYCGMVERVCPIPFLSACYTGLSSASSLSRRKPLGIERDCAFPTLPNTTVTDGGLLSRYQFNLTPYDAKYDYKSTFCQVHT